MEGKGIIIYLLVLTISVMIVVTYMIVDIHKKNKAVLEQIMEIKSKIGAVVRAFNINAMQDHSINMQQQEDIESLQRKSNIRQ
jgi:hypothetical protein